MIELMLAVGIFSIIMAMGLPKLTQFRDRGAVRSAKQQVSAYLATARAAAIRRGRPAQFRRAGNTIWVTVGTSGAPLQTIASPIPLDSEYAVTLSGGLDSVVFDARGFVTNLTATQTYRMARAGFTDSLCVSRVGLVAAVCGF